MRRSSAYSTGWGLCSQAYFAISGISSLSSFLSYGRGQGLILCSILASLSMCLVKLRRRFSMCLTMCFGSHCGLLRCMPITVLLFLRRMASHLWSPNALAESPCFRFQDRLAPRHRNNRGRKFDGRFFSRVSNGSFARALRLRVLGLELGFGFRFADQDPVDDGFGAVGYAFENKQLDPIVAGFRRTELRGKGGEVV